MAKTKTLSLLFIISITLYFREVLLQSYTLVKNVNCQTVDNNFCRFEICKASPDSDGSKEYNIFIRLLKLPITNCKLQFELKPLTLSNVPMLFNATYDACQFMKNRKRFRVLNRFYNAIQPFVNVNHTCPYNVGDNRNIFK